MSDKEYIEYLCSEICNHIDALEKIQKGVITDVPGLALQLTNIMRLNLTKRNA